MTWQQNEPPRDSAAGTARPGPPRPRSGTQERRPIGSFTAYSEAERAVDHLSDQKFPVERVAIIGRDVQLVEQVVGRLNYGKAALSGAGSGAVPGLLIGWLFGLFNWIQPVLASLTLALYGLVFGAVAGAVVGLIMHALQGGRRDFSAVRTWQPTRYEVEADVEVADEAARILAARDPAASDPAPPATGGPGPSGPAAPGPAASDSAPTEHSRRERPPRDDDPAS